MRQPVMACSPADRRIQNRPLTETVNYLLALLPGIFKSSLIDILSSRPVRFIYTSARFDSSIETYTKKVGLNSSLPTLKQTVAIFLFTSTYY